MKSYSFFNRTGEWLALFVGFIVLSSCVPNDFDRARVNVSQAPPSMPLLAFGDDHDWIVLKPIVYIIGDTNDHIIVPAGFVTDLASIPKEFWGPPWYLTPTGQYGRAAIIHDYLYWTQKCTRGQADRLLVIAMKESGVKGFDEFAIYRGLKIGGKSGWDADEKEKASGVPRFLPPGRRSPPDPNMTWPVYSKELMSAGVQSTADSTVKCDTSAALE